MAMGSIPFEAGGRSLAIRFGINALVHLETVTGKSANQLFNDMGRNPPMSLLRSVFAAGIVADPKPTEEQVGDMMDELTLERVGSLITQAMEAAYPKAEAKRGKPDQAKVR